MRFLHPFSLVAVLAGVGACGWDVYEFVPVADTGGAGGVGGEGGSTGGEGGEGGTGGEGGAPANGCGRIDLMQDDFSDGVRGYIWNATGTVSEGTSLITEAGSTNAVGLYRSSRRYDITGGRVTVDVDLVPDSAVSMSERGVFRLEYNDGRFAEFRVNTNDLAVGYHQNGAFQRLNMPTVYDMTLHRQFRFTEADGVLTWQVAGDDGTFTEIASAPTTAVFPSTKRLRVALGAAYGISGVTSVAEWDNISGFASDSLQAWCPIAVFRDDFEDGFLSDEWLNTNGSAAVTGLETEGNVVLTLAPGVSATKTWVSSQAYDVTGDAASIEIVETSAAPSTTFFELRGDTAAVTIRVVSSIDMMTMEEKKEIEAVVDSKEDDALVLTTEDYDPAAYRWVRIRDDDGALVFERSTDGGAWEEWARQSPARVPVEDVLIAFGLTSTAAAATPGQTRFDNLNNAPE